MIHSSESLFPQPFSSPSVVPYQLRRMGVVMRPLPLDPMEVGGVLNPGGVRSPDGSFMLFPRLVAAGNYSRIGLARVINDADGIPCDVERLGVVLEPETPYERASDGRGGCEDARVVHVPALGGYVMTYVALGPVGPRPAMAMSSDLETWTRLGLVDFSPLRGADMNLYPNKDHMLFPEPVPGPDGRLSIAMLHRPMFERPVKGDPHGRHHVSLPPGVLDERWSAWISYCPLEDADWAMPGSGRRPSFSGHQPLFAPAHQWEGFRLGAGTPPLRLAEGWLTIYHGVERVPGATLKPSLRYNAAALIMDHIDPRRVVYRSPTPTLEPQVAEERCGVVSDVVFPTAVDQHDTHLDVYYGMADYCIGVARMDLRPAASLAQIPDPGAIEAEFPEELSA